MRKGREGERRREEKRRADISVEQGESLIPIYAPYSLPQLAQATGQRADAPEKPSCRKRKLTFPPEIRLEPWRPSKGFLSEGIRSQDWSLPF